MKKLIEAATQDCMGVQQVDPDLLVKQVVGECVLAILATDTRSLVYTTWDRDMVTGVIRLVVDNVRNYFEEQNA